MSTAQQILDRTTRLDAGGDDAAIRDLVAACLERVERDGTRALDAFCEQHPDHARIGATPTNLSDLLEELRIIRETLTGSEVLSDMQLFSQLRNLGDIKAALVRMSDNPVAQRMVGEVDKLLETMFASSRFA